MSAVLDLVGLKCPLPALRTGKALDRLAPGAVLTVITSDPLAGIDIPHLVGQRGDTILDQVTGTEVSTFRILRGG